MILLVLLVQVGQGFADPRRLVEVQLRVVLREEGLELGLRAGVQHALLKLMLVLLFVADLNVLIFLQIAVLEQGRIFLPKIRLTV